MNAHVLLTLLAVTALAGCLDGGDPVDGTGGEDVSAMPQLHGWVFDSAVAPIPDVEIQVTVSNIVEEIATDADGFYGFDNLPTDQPVILTARADGFIPKTNSVTIPFDATIQLNFTLERQPVITPYKERLGAFQGNIACQYFVGSDEAPMESECGTGSDDNRWQMTVGKDFAGGVVEVAWNENTALSENLRATVECATPGQCGDVIPVFAEAVGPSCLRLEIANIHAQKYFSDGGIMVLTVYVDPANDANEAGVGASVAVNQGFEAIADMFYHAPPPSGHTICES